LRQRGLDAIAQINVHAGGGVSFLFHAAESKTVKRGAGEKISYEEKICEILIFPSNFYNFIPQRTCVFKEY
jgi:hypothetical protein